MISCQHLKGRLIRHPSSYVKFFAAGSGCCLATHGAMTPVFFLLSGFSMQVLIKCMPPDRCREGPYSAEAT